MPSSGSHEHISQNTFRHHLVASSCRIDTSACRIDTASCRIDTSHTLAGISHHLVAWTHPSPSGSSVCVCVGGCVWVCVWVCVCVSCVWVCLVCVCVCLVCVSCVAGLVRLRLLRHAGPRPPVPRQEVLVDPRRLAFIRFAFAVACIRNRFAVAFIRIVFSVAFIWIACAHFVKCVCVCL